MFCHRKTCINIKSAVERVDSTGGEKWKSVVQLLLVLTTIEATLWTAGKTQQRWYVVATMTLILCVVWSRPRVNELGVGGRGFLAACWVLPVAAVVSSAILLIAWQAGSLRVLYGREPVYLHGMGYAIWALEQQFILNSFFYRRFENLMGDNVRALVATAVLFSLVHIPNPVLVPATLIAGLFFVAAFQKFRNIYPLAVAHALLGLTLAVSIPDHWIHHMRVGLGFFRFHVQG